MSQLLSRSHRFTPVCFRKAGGKPILEVVEGE